VDDHPARRTSRAGQRAATTIMRRLPGTLVDIALRTLASFVRLEGFDRAMALAGQAFAALLPLLIVVAALSPGGSKDLADSLIDRFNLSGSSAEVLHDAVAQPAAVQDGVSALSAFLLIISALSFTRAMQRLYVRAWELPSLGLAGNGWGLAWLMAFSVYSTLQPLVVGLFTGVPEFLASVSLSFGLWLFTPWILVGRRIHWRRLLPQAVLTSVGLAALTVGSLLYLPRAIGSAAAQFGFIGVAFALLSFLFCASLVLVVAAALGSTLAGERERRLAETRPATPA
jgi:membrane protein